VHEGPAYERALDDARRRDRAERQRLAYVAATRASKAMFFVGDRAASEKGDGDTSTTAAVLRAIASDDVAKARAFLAVENVQPDFSAAPATVAGLPIDADVAWTEVSVPAWRALPMAPAALEDFAHCARRFQLAHLQGMPEADEGSARTAEALVPKVLARVDLASFGAPLLARTEVSRALEREGVASDHAMHGLVVERIAGFLLGAYATRVATARAHVSRAVPLVHDAVDSSSRAVTLSGVVDLVVRWKDGSVDLLDASCSRGSVATHALRLEAHAVAARTIAPDATRVRSGLALLGVGGEPAWLAKSASELDAARARITDLGGRVVEARWADRFAPEPIATCHAIDCGYVRFCHPGGAGARGSSRP
jgi:ATP-dependent exoDNAse (exonuclease V) beta subunit